MPLYAPPTKNALQKTLSSQLLSGNTASAALSDTVGLQNLPGIMVIDRVDSNGADTATKREFIAYTGISGSNVTGLTRNVDSGSTDQDHAIGAIVEFVPDVVWAQSMYDSMVAFIDPSTMDLNTNIVQVDNFSTYFGDYLATTATLSAKTLVKPTVSASVQNLATASDGATITFDLSTSNVHTVVLGGARTLALSNVTVGQSFVIRLVQDGTGGRTVTWFSTIKWANGTTPTLTSTLNKTDVFGFICTSSGNYDGFVIGQNL